MEFPDMMQLEKINDIAWIKDRLGRFVAVNRAFSKEFRIATDEVVGKSDYFVFQLQLAERLLANDLEVLRAGRPLRIEETIFRNEVRRQVEAVKSPILDAGGDILGTLTVMRDLPIRPCQSPSGRELPKRNREAGD